MPADGLIEKGYHRISSRLLYQKSFMRLFLIFLKYAIMSANSKNNTVVYLKLFNSYDITFVSVLVELRAHLEHREV